MSDQGPGPDAQMYRDEIERALMTLNLNVDNLARVGGDGTRVSYTINVRESGAPWIDLQFS